MTDRGCVTLRLSLPLLPFLDDEICDHSLNLFCRGTDVNRDRRLPHISLPLALDLQELVKNSFPLQRTGLSLELISRRRLLLNFLADLLVDEVLRLLARLDLRFNDLV